MVKTRRQGISWRRVFSIAKDHLFSLCYFKSGMSRIFSVLERLRDGCGVFRQGYNMSIACQTFILPSNSLTLVQRRGNLFTLAKVSGGISFPSKLFARQLK